MGQVSLCTMYVGMYDRVWRCMFVWMYVCVYACMNEYDSKYALIKESIDQV